MIRPAPPRLPAAACAAAVLLAAACARGPVTARVRVDPGTRLQTMRGWEATAMAGQEDTAFTAHIGRAVELAIDSLGIDRLRLPVRAGSEFDRDLFTEWRAGRLPYRDWRCLRYRTINDNDDPARLDPRGFHWDELDLAVESVVLPAQRRLAARGERLYVSVNYTAFDQCRTPTGTLHHADPEEYAEFALAVMLHLRDAYGLVPDAWEMILEPEHNARFPGRRIGEMMVATARRLAAAGFHPELIAPSTTNVARAVQYTDELAAVPGALPLLAELSYHRYGGAIPENLRAVGERSRRYGVPTAMLEKIGAGVDELFEDLELAGVSAWQQYIITFPGDSTDDTAAGHYVKVRRHPGGAFAITLAPRARLLRQVFRYVRRGSWRIGATSDRDAVQVRAFADPCGGTVAVARARRPARITIEGLAAGAYAATWTADSTEGRVDDVPLVQEAATVEIPAPGVITVFPREPGSAAPMRCAGTGPRP